MRLRAGSALATLAGLALVGLLGILPAGAQWIGAPGGSTDGASSGAVTIAPASQGELPAAQSAPGFSPGAAPGYSPGLGAAPGVSVPQQPNPDAANCQGQVAKLREDLESRGGALQKATGAKRPPSELCPMFRNFANAQQAFYSFLNTNKTKCGVPDDILVKFKANVASVNNTRNRVCEVAKMQESGAGAGPGGPPPQGALSAGLGLSTGLPTMGAPPGGVFDTLGGDALR